MPVNSNTNTIRRNGIQAVDIIQLVGEIIWLLIQIFYYNLESIYRLFVPPPETSVKGEIVLVTGAGHGIGKQIALHYATLGATVVAWDINEKNNSETVKEINKTGYAKAYGYVCDVSNRSTVFETVERVRKEVGNITIIVNNAGIMPTHSLLDHTQDEIERTFKINVFAHFWVIQAVLPNMLESNHGHIVSISSCAGIMGIENLVPYCGTKYAVRGYMEALEMELRMYKPNCQVKFTTICPYMVDTGLCKRPKVRFEGTMDMLKPDYVAQKTIEAQRRGIREITVPSYYWYLNLLTRMGSSKGGYALKQFFDVTLESDL